MHLAADQIAVDLGAEGAAHRFRRRVESQKHTAPRLRFYLKSLLLQPLPHRGQIMRAGAETVAELFRRKPFSIVR